MLHKPGFKERMRIKDLEIQLGEPVSANDIDVDDEESVMNSSFVSTQSDMRKSQSVFRTTLDKFGGSDSKKKAPIVFKEVKAKPKQKSKLDEIIDTEEKFKEFMNMTNLQMLEIKSRADQILNFRKKVNESRLTESRVNFEESSSESEEDGTATYRTKGSTDATTKSTDISTSNKDTESIKDSRIILDEEQLKQLEEKYKGQFIGSREDAKAVKRNIIIRLVYEYNKI